MTNHAKTTACAIGLALALQLHVAWSQADAYQPNIPPQLVTQLEQTKQFLVAGRPEEAIPGLERLVKANPDYFSAAYNLGLAYSDLRQYDNALAMLTRAREIRERLSIADATVYNALGYTYVLSGQPRKAEESYLQGLKNVSLLTSDSKRRLYNNIGNLYLNVGRYEDAQKYLGTAAQEYKSTVARENLKVLGTVREISVQQDMRANIKK